MPVLLLCGPTWYTDIEMSEECSESTIENLALFEYSGSAHGGEGDNHTDGALLSRISTLMNTLVVNCAWQIIIYVGYLK